MIIALKRTAQHAQDIWPHLNWYLPISQSTKCVRDMYRGTDREAKLAVDASKKELQYTFTKSNKI